MYLLYFRNVLLLGLEVLVIYECYLLFGFIHMPTDPIFLYSHYLYFILYIPLII